MGENNCNSMLTKGLMSKMYKKLHNSATNRKAVNKQTNIQIDGFPNNMYK